METIINIYLFLWVYSYLMIESIAIAIKHDSFISMTKNQLLDFVNLTVKELFWFLVVIIFLPLYGIVAILLWIIKRTN